MTLESGTNLGPYRVTRKLGAGGMGEVYAAQDPRLGREVAIKVLPKDMVRDAESLRRFQQEANTVAALNHTNIVQIFDVGATDDGSPFLVMELLDGESLRVRMDGRPMALRKVVEISTQLARALGAAHAKGIIHRDLHHAGVGVEGLGVGARRAGYLGDRGRNLVQLLQQFAGGDFLHFQGLGDPGGHGGRAAQGQDLVGFLDATAVAVRQGLEHQLGHAREGIPHALAAGGTGLEGGCMEAIDLPVQHVRGQRVGGIPLVPLDHVGEFLQIRALILEVIDEVLEALLVALHGRSLGVGTNTTASAPRSTSLRVAS